MSRPKLTFYALMLVAIALTASCGGETVVTKVKLDAPAGSQPNEGVLFSLPETVVMAEVPLTKVASSPGKFSNWTPFFFPELTTDEFTTEEKTVFKVGLATFSTRGQTDPKNVYIAHIKAKQFETKTLLLEFNEDGIVARTEASSKDDSIDVVTSGIKTVAAAEAKQSFGRLLDDAQPIQSGLSATAAAWPWCCPWPSTSSSSGSRTPTEASRPRRR